MKSVPKNSLAYWSFVPPITAVFATGIARYEGIRLALATVGVALLLEYLVDVAIR